MNFADSYYRVWRKITIEFGGTFTEFGVARVCAFFRHAPSPTGWVPPKKEVFRLSYQFFIREFCSTFGRRLGIAFLFSRSLKSCRRSYVRRSLSNVHRTFFTPESTFLSHVNVRTIITHDAAHTIASLGYVLFFGTPLPLRGGSLRKRKFLG